MNPIPNFHEISQGVRVWHLSNACTNWHSRKKEEDLTFPAPSTSSPVQREVGRTWSPLEGQGDWGTETEDPFLSNLTLKRAHLYDKTPRDGLCSRKTNRMKISVYPSWMYPNIILCHSCKEKLWDGQLLLGLFFSTHPPGTDVLPWGRAGHQDLRI